MTLLVVGGGSGIGRATAIDASPPDVVVVGDRDVAAAADVARARRDAGHEATSVAVDVTDFDSCASAVAAADAEGGGLDAVVVTAGTLVGDGRLADIASEAWHHVLDVNLTGSANVVRAALPVLVARGGGAVVLVSSIAAVRGRRGLAAYSASKAGLLGLMRSVATDYGPAGVRVNAVCLGPTETPMTDGLSTRAPLNAAGRSAEPAEVASAILWLVGAGARWVNGAELVVDQGETAMASGMVRP